MEHLRISWCTDTANDSVQVPINDTTAPFIAYICEAVKRLDGYNGYTAAVVPGFVDDAPTIMCTQPCAGSNNPHSLAGMRAALCALFLRTTGTAPAASTPLTKWQPEAYVALRWPTAVDDSLTFATVIQYTGNEVALWRAYLASGKRICMHESPTLPAMLFVNDSDSESLYCYDDGNENECGVDDDARVLWPYSNEPVRSPWAAFLQKWSRPWRNPKQYLGHSKTPLVGLFWPGQILEIMKTTDTEPRKRPQGHSHCFQAERWAWIACIFRVFFLK